MSEPYPLPDSLLALVQDMPLEELAFTPVPVRARRDGWTAEAQKGFILRLALSGCVTKAAEGVGKTRKSAYRLLERQGSESFAAAWDKAYGWGADRMVDRAVVRAILGDTVPYFYKGERRGERVLYPTGLTIAVLNALDRREAKHAPGGAHRAFHEALAALGDGHAAGAPIENKRLFTEK